ncbi:energy transducer TonB, partial [Pseudomonas syringae pv. tagetis]
WYTGQALIGSHVAHLRTEPQRQVLLVQLAPAIPMIVSNFRSNPDRLYGDYLPTPMKALMVCLSEKVEGRE